MKLRSSVAGGGPNKLFHPEQNWVPHFCPVLAEVGNARSASAFVLKLSS
jgi:hypothetical protein